MLKKSPDGLVYHSGYLPHIDGVRAFAILPVLLYHLNSSFCPGGFAGVDVFFVISGYLITKNILGDIRGGKFSIAEFYNRRVKRIIPAYFFMMFAVLLFAPLVYFAEPLVSTAKSAFASNFFLANWELSRHAGYFRVHSLPNPLLHMWSLSVEEQFYIFLPIALFLLSKYCPRVLSLCLWAVAGLSFAVASWRIYKEDPVAAQRVFFFLPYRAWELLAGSLLAYISPIKSVSKSGGKGGATTSLLAPLGIAVMMVSYCILNKRMGFPAYSALPFVLSTVLMLRFGNVGPVRRLLENGALVFVGKISYSLYLWHWPIIVFWKYIQYDILGPADYACITLCSFAMAALSWKFVEMPVRASRTWTKRHSLILFLTLAAASSALCVVYYKTKGFSKFIHKEANAIPAAEDHIEKINFATMTRNGEIFSVMKIGDKNAAPEMAFLGDSHGQVLARALDEILKEKGLSCIYVLEHVKFVWNADIRLARGIVGRGNMDREVMGWLAEQKNIKKVFMANRWNILTKMTGYGYLDIEQVDVINKKIDLPDNEILAHDLPEHCRMLKDSGKEIFIFASFPEFRYNVDEYERKIRIIRHEDDLSLSKEEYAERNAETSAILKDIESAKLAKILHGEEIFFIGNRYTYWRDGMLTYEDDDHISSVGARLVWRSFGECVGQ